eukprot:1604846-Alexandrium_andersonii.AAC.1
MPPLLPAPLAEAACRRAAPGRSLLRQPPLPASPVPRRCQRCLPLCPPAAAATRCHSSCAFTRGCQLLQMPGSHAGWAGWATSPPRGQ